MLNEESRSVSAESRQSHQRSDGAQLLPFTGRPRLTGCCDTPMLCQSSPACLVNLRCVSTPGRGNNDCGYNYDDAAAPATAISRRVNANRNRHCLKVGQLKAHQLLPVWWSMNPGNPG
jgi:hypothetical protein